MDKLVVKVPSYIKQWYIDESNKYGQKTAPYVSLILIQNALDNGAKKTSVMDVFNNDEVF